MRGDSPLFPVNNPLPSAVEVISIVRRFGTVSALAGVSLAIRPGEFFSLLGARIGRQCEQGKAG